MRTSLIRVLFPSFVLAWTTLPAPGGSASGQDLNGAAVPVVVRAYFELDDTTRQGTLVVTADIQEGHHIYAMSQPKPYIATRIHVDGSSPVRLTGGFTESQRPDILVDDFGDALHKHESRAEWTTRFQVPDSGAVDLHHLQITGHLYAQACSDQGCLMPTRYPFVASLAEVPFEATGTSRSHGNGPRRIPLGQPRDGQTALREDEQAPGQASRAASVVQAVPLTDSSPPEAGAATALEAGKPSELDLANLHISESSRTSMSLALVIPMALAAGLILNFMPCVLPVIGLKVMSFAQQAGDHRSRVLLLNVWYATGVLSVFLILATLAVVLGIGWGQQFSSVAFNIVLAASVFVFALSFLGIWEIPIPGLAGSTMANALAQREGLIGALAKGVLTTVLATPCSGPMLGPALTWATGQSPLLTYVVFGCVGVGMSSPYLLIGAFPKLVSLLPKPGEWMNTLKHVMGFGLLGTVVYIMSFIPVSFVVPFLAFMVGLWVACWWIGRVPLTEHWDKIGATWIQAAGIAAVIGFLSFGWLQRVMEDRLRQMVDRRLAAMAADSGNVLAALSNGQRPAAGGLPWKPYSHAALKTLIAEQKTVLVDFTADWCLTCKANESVAFNTSEMKQFVVRHGIETLKADKTHPAPEADELLRALGNESRAIPFCAIFPADRPDQPILLDGVFTSPRPILAALRRATPRVASRRVR